MTQSELQRIISDWQAAQDCESAAEFGDADRCWARIQDVAHGCAFRGRRDSAAYLLYLIASERREMCRALWNGRAW